MKKNLIAFGVYTVLFAVCFGGYKGYQWWTAAPTGSMDAVKLSQSMVTSSDWTICEKEGRSNLPCIINEKQKLIVYCDGKVTAFKFRPDKQVEGGRVMCEEKTLTMFTADTKYIQQKYAEARMKIEQRVFINAEEHEHHEVLPPPKAE